MPINTTLVDSEGFDRDIFGDANGVGVNDGENDAFDGGLRLVVNGVAVAPGEASLDGRELNAQPVLIGGIAVQRSILVSDAAISPIGFARFLDSFTNTTDTVQVITVELVSNSGADGTFSTPFTSSGNTVLTLDDVGFTTDDADQNGADPSVAFAYGDGASGSVLPTGAGAVVDNTTVTFTLTLQPGETQSLLQFASQSVTTAEAQADVINFNTDAANLDLQGLLAGLSREEQLSIVNYSGFDTLQPANTLVDADGNVWGITDQGGLTTVSNGTLTAFAIPAVDANFTTTQSVTVDAANDEVTVVTDGFFTGPDITATYTYRALQDQAVIRLLFTIENNDLGVNFNPFAPIVNLGLAPAQVVFDPLDAIPALPNGVVLDDSESGSGGTLPALTWVFGNAGGDIPSLGGSTYSNQTGSVFVPQGGTVQFVYFFALNDTGLQSLLDLTRLNTPGPQELAGLTRDQVANLSNFDLTEADRLQTTLGTAGDNIITGHAWGDSIDGGAGDDDIAAGASDDVAQGGAGDDVVDGGDGADSLFGGNQDDNVTGGSGNDQVNGDDGNDYLGGQTGDDAVFGGLGNDTLIGASGGDRLFGDSDNDILSGNRGVDTLEGGSGDDTLNGGAGADTMNGGIGSDVFIVNIARDVVVELSTDAGFDEVRSGVGFAVGGQSIELVTLTGTANINATGDIFANHLVGNGGNNRLRGNGGADTLDGGLGVDTLIGGDGGDVYIVNDNNDVIIETAAGTGIDEIRSAGSYDMGVQFIELITLTGTADTLADGTAAAERLVGNVGDNFLNGNDGADTLEGGDGGDDLVGGSEGDRLFGGNGLDFLDGGGGADSIEGGDDDDFVDGGDGADTVLGGLGDDTVFGGSSGTDVGDQLFGGEGGDEIDGGAGIDLLFGGNGDDQLNGGADADRLFGGTGADTLAGGSPFDTGINQLSGGADGDVYVVNSANDRVIELATDTGTDFVISTISYTLTDNVEQLQLVASLTPLNGTGNAGANLLSGNSTANILDGRGGADTMEGGLGDDTYVVDNRADVVRELFGTAEGIDTVRSSLSYLLDDNVENLQLAGAGRIDGTGNAAANIISGNAFANTLIGGLGNDTLTSGAGSDAFLFNLAPGSDNIDHITDFAVGRDVIYLDDAIFTALNLGRPPVFRFVNGTAALDADDHLLYDIATGTLRYDADGNGAGASVVFAILDNNAALVNGSFLVL